MNILFILDKDHPSKIADDFRARIMAAAKKKGHRIEFIDLSRNNILPCLGCLKCLTVHPGVCVNKDIMAELKKKARESGMIILLSPAVFGQCSSAIKNVLDRGLTSRVGEERKTPPQFIIGYGTDIDREEKSTFIDITARHTGKADICHPEFKNNLIESFVTKSIKENSAVCGKIAGLF